jgi:hypothetical protein
MNLHFSTCALVALLLTWPRPQTDPTEPKALPGAILAGLVHAQEVYCEDQFGNKHKKGCDKKFASHLQWSKVVIAPGGETAILAENQNQGFCGSARCALYLVVQKADGSYAQILGKQGDVGTLERFAVLKEISKRHFNIQVTWSDGKGHSTYSWNGTRYAAHGE